MIFLDRICKIEMHHTTGTGMKVKPGRVLKLRSCRASKALMKSRREEWDQYSGFF